MFIVLIKRRIVPKRYKESAIYFEHLDFPKKNEQCHSFLLRIYASRLKKSPKELRHTSRLKPKT